MLTNGNIILKNVQLSVTKEEIKGFAKMFKEAMAKTNISCIGNTDKINEAKDLFKEIRPLSK